ncbi:MAG: histidine kinase [Methylotenera sp.]|uniref:sensor histidine kinase n=1 Tax=Methylotenera sp. TaxID=2051956 RepID=UPI0017DD0D85|nr:histidine kinase [Methylotenera sp.]NOU25046.1 two-component sensor histidine kinase [Methylotenera sp.]
MKLQEIWLQLSNSRKDAIKASVLVFLAYLFVLKINLAETLTVKLEKFENLQLDEMPFLFLFISVALAWFTQKRVVEKKKEISLRVLAEEKNTQLLTENKALTQHILRVQELERLQLARDLHDDIGQYLLAIRLDASSLTVCEDNPSANPARRILSNAGHIQQMTRILMRRLRPAPTSSQNCIEAIRQLAQEWLEQQPRIVFELDMDELADLLSENENLLSEQVSVVVYRFIQEALTNIAKHAGASHVAVSLAIKNNSVIGKQHPTHLTIEIKDDGNGLDMIASAHGMGMLGMRERINAVNGEFKVVSKLAEGVTLWANIPINQ